MFQIDSWIGSLPKNSFPELSAMSFTQNQALLQEMDMEVYLITNTVNDKKKKYVGITQHKHSKRFRQHINAANRGLNTVICNAIRKYGEKAFTIALLDKTSDIDNLCDLEFHYIKQYNTKAPNGYNVTDGGDGITGFSFSEESKKKMSASAIGKPSWNKGKKGLQVAWNKGQPMSDEQKKKISIAKIGKTVSEETKRKMSIAHTGITHSEETKKKLAKIQTGRKYSEESRNKMSESQKGHTAWNKGKVLSEEHKRKLSEARKGKRPWNKGKPHSEQHKKKLSEAWVHRRVRDLNQEVRP